MNRKLLIILVIIGALLCTSCALFPKEEVLPEAPELLTKTKEYTLIPVTRGDLTLTLKEKCTYEAGVQEALFFSVVGEPISNVFVSKGEAVTAGTLIAELESTALREQIDAEKKAIDSLTLQVAQTEERLGLYYEKCSALEIAAAAEPMYAFQLEAAQRSCLRIYNDLEFLKKDLAVEQMAMDDLTAQLSQRQIFAGIDGTVTYTLQLNEGHVQRSYPQQAICRISDMSTGRFVATVEAGALKVGDAVTVIYDEIEHGGKIKNITKDDKRKNTDIVDIELDFPDESLTANMTGQLVVILDERKDVLLVPEASVDILADGKSLVYYLNENGVRFSKEVEIGLVADGMVEIVSGLEEGELIVK